MCVEGGAFGSGLRVLMLLPKYVRSLHGVADATFKQIVISAATLEANVVAIYHHDGLAPTFETHYSENLLGRRRH